MSTMESKSLQGIAPLSKEIFAKNKVLICCFLSIKLILSTKVIISPIIYASFINTLISSLSITSVYYSVVNIAIIEFGYLAVSYSLNVCENILLPKMSNCITMTMCNKILNSRFSLLNIKTNFISDVIINDSKTISTFFSGSLISLLIKSIEVTIMSFLLFKKSHMFFFVIVTTIPVLLTNYKIFQPKIFSIAKKTIDASSKYNSEIMRVIANIKIIRRQSLVENAMSILSDEFIKFRSALLNSTRLSVGFGCSIEFCQLLLFVVSLLICSTSIKSKTMTVGDLTIIISYSQNIFSSSNFIANIAKSWNTCKCSLIRILYYYNMEQETNGSIKIPSINTISIHNPTVTISNSKHISYPHFEIHGNGIYIIKGESGIGKTTLLNSICGLEQLSRGSIKINNIDIKHLDMEHARKNNIAFIDQECSTYSNIESIKNSLDNSKYREVLNIQDTNKFTSTKEYATLSGGEKQRISMILALDCSANLFILDEPSSHLDTKNKISLALLLNELSSTNIIIITTHDDFFAKHCIVRKEIILGNSSDTTHGDELAFIDKHSIVPREQGISGATPIPSI